MKKLLFVLAFAFIGQQAFSQIYLVTLSDNGIGSCTNQEILLTKITNVLGQETKETKNKPLFYIYDDGTVEKRIVIE